jgi:hypothetical protein
MFRKFFVFRRHNKVYAQFEKLELSKKGTTVLETCFKEQPFLKLVSRFFLLNLDFSFIIYLPLLAPYFDRACFLFITPCKSKVPRITLYFTPGKSLTRPPRTRTTECSCKL